MSHSDYVAILDFSNRLKADFPTILPHSFSDRMLNMANEHARKMIDLELEWVKMEWDKSVREEAKSRGEE